jgi:hypothetical protein
MNRLHLSNDQLLDRIYGLAGDDPHFDACPECQARWTHMQLLREQSSLPTPGAAFFHRQRRAVLERIAEPPRTYGWVPATVAAALMVVLAVTRTAPEPTAPAPKAETALIEAGWFEETYSATRALEPAASSPLRELFVESPVVE